MINDIFEDIDVPEAIGNVLPVLSKQYKLGKAVFKGMNGYLIPGRNRLLDTNVAIKIYYWGGDDFHVEPRMLKQVNSPNVLSILDANYIDNEWAYFVTPFCEQGDLDDLMEREKIGNRKAIELIRGILNGLSYLHAKRFLHRDVKPANIYIHGNGIPVIGDFGSVKLLPDGMDSIPASNHAVLYRPPEAIDLKEYSFVSDVYQAGIVLYQLLGGYLPYEPMNWLKSNEVNEYNSIEDVFDRSKYIDKCIHKKIIGSRLLRMETLPQWVPSQLKRVIKKACHIDKNQRFSSPADFMAVLNEVLPKIKDWRVIEGVPTLMAPTSYRVVEDGGKYQVQKRRGGSQWRNDNSFNHNTLAEIIEDINSRVL